MSNFQVPKYTKNQRYMQVICNVFSEKFFARMLKNILAEHTELLPFINYKQYICRNTNLKHERYEQIYPTNSLDR